MGQKKRAVCKFILFKAFGACFIIDIVCWFKVSLLYSTVLLWASQQRSPIWKWTGLPPNLGGPSPQLTGLTFLFRSWALEAVVA